MKGERVWGCELGKLELKVYFRFVRYYSVVGKCEIRSIYVITLKNRWLQGYLGASLVVFEVRWVLMSVLKCYIRRFIEC